MNGNNVALWAGVSAFFGSLLTITVVDVFNPDKVVQYLAAIVVALITGGAVYSKERLQHAKTKNERMEKVIKKDAQR